MEGVLLDKAYCFREVTSAIKQLCQRFVGGQGPARALLAPEAETWSAPAGRFLSCRWEQSHQAEKLRGEGVLAAGVNRHDRKVAHREGFVRSR